MYFLKLYSLIFFCFYFRIYSNDDNNNILNEGVDIDITGMNETSIDITSALESDQHNVEQFMNLSLPPHQRCAAHTLNLIATVDIHEAEKDFTYKSISRKVFKKCQSLFNKQNQSTLSADIIKKHLGRYLITPNATR